MQVKDFDREGFERWMEENTQLRPLSIKVYSSYVRNILEATAGDPKKIGQHITLKHRRKNCYNQVFAIKHYFNYIGKKAPLDLPLLKKKPRKKMGVFLKLSDLKAIVNRLKEQNSFYYPVAVIQLVAGSRPRETLSFRRSMFKEECDGVTIILDAKGGVEGAKFIPKPYSEEILEVLRLRTAEYPFLRGVSTDIEHLVSNNYRYYHRDLANASGMQKFSPHDFRRNFGSDYYKQTLDIFKTQMALGHKDPSTTIRYLPEFGGADFKSASKVRMKL